MKGRREGGIGRKLDDRGKAGCYAEVRRSTQRMAAQRRASCWPPGLSQLPP